MSTDCSDLYSANLNQLIIHTKLILLNPRMWRQPKSYVLVEKHCYVLVERYFFSLSLSSNMLYKPLALSARGPC